MLFGINFPPKFSLSLSKFCQAPVNAWLFRFLPFRVSRWYLAFLGRIYYWLKKTEKNLIQRTIHHIYGACLDPCSLTVLGRKVFKGIIDHYHEKLFLAYSNFSRLLRFLKHRITLEGEEELQELVRQGRGAIVVTGHYGAVEFLPGALAVRGYPVSMICRFQTNRLRVSLKKRAEAVGLELIDADDGKVFLAAIKALKSGRLLITECDEFDEWRTGDGRQVDFLKCRLAGDRTLELLHKRSGAAVAMALMQREGRKRYTLKLSRVAPEAAGPSWDPSPACLRVLEAAMAKTPEQWYQWKKFGQMLNLQPEVKDAHPETGYLGPELEVTVPVQA
jgi:KDO2-lipid IV(A) lauroyltransferase